MSYSNEYYQRALTLISDNKKRKNKEYELSLLKLYNAVPELTDIDNKLSAIGAKAMMAAMTGKQDEVKRCKAASQQLQEKKDIILKSANIKAPEVSCKICNDTGYVGTNICECAKYLAKQLVFKDFSAEMPINYQTFATFSLDYYSGESRAKMSEILKTTRYYAETFTKCSENLLLVGNTGLGKTHLSMAIINAVTERGYGVIYGSAQNLFNKIEREHFSYADQTPKTDAILNCDLLVIDDLGAEFSTPFTVSQFYNIINTRINCGLPTVINTNLSPNDIEEKYTPRILSRLVGNYKILNFCGDDIRIKKALNK